MDDQRVAGRAPLGCENPRNGRRIPGVRAEAVDGFSRECDKLACIQLCNSFFNPGGVGRHGIMIHGPGGRRAYSSGTLCQPVSLRRNS